MAYKFESKFKWHIFTDICFTFSPGSNTCTCCYLSYLTFTTSTSQEALVVKNPPTNAGDMKVTGSSPGSGRSPGGGHGHPLQYSCLQNPIDREAWQAIVCGFAKRQAQLKWLGTQCKKDEINIKYTDKLLDWWWEFGVQHNSLLFSIFLN